MKIAISIPLQDFQAAERLASRSRKSRSELISDAVREYVARHAPEEVTYAMDRFCDELDATPAAPNADPEWLAFAPNNGEPSLATERAWISQGQVWWAGHRALVIVQCDAINRSRSETVVCVPLTRNLKWAEAPGSITLSARMSGLPIDSVAKASQIATLPRCLLTKSVGEIPRAKLNLILAEVDTVLGKPAVKER
jgi:mRNA interferase MazF